ncbi:unnamed protein product, partial [Medioppia subpectinata]
MDIVLRHKLDETSAESKTSDANYITENEILANSWVFFNSGCKIISSTLSFATYELARNQRIQQTLYEEIAAAVAPDGHIGMDALNKLPFLEAVVSESLRLHTVSIRIRRIADRDYRLGDTGITIEKGHTVDIPVHAMHHYEPYYPNYQQFDPGRFLNKNDHSNGTKPYAYIPFSDGNRVCLAKRYALLEIKTTLAKLVRRYRFYTTDNTDIPVRLVSSLFHYSPQLMYSEAARRKIPRPAFPEKAGSPCDYDETCELWECGGYQIAKGKRGYCLDPKREDCLPNNKKCVDDEECCSTKCEITFSTYKTCTNYFTRNHNYWAKRGVNGPKPVPGFGNTLSPFLTEPVVLEKQWVQKYGKVYGIYEANKPILTVADAALIKAIVATDSHVFRDNVTDPILQAP